MPFQAGYENDTLYGGDGNDDIYGWNGNDLIYGDAGNDVLVGCNTTDDSGTDYDTLSGGVGADTFVLGSGFGVNYLGAGYAIITDFDYSEGDKFQVLDTTTSYSLSYLDFGVGTSNSDTGIFYNNDLLAIVQDTTDVLYPTDFVSF